MPTGAPRAEVDAVVLDLGNVLVRWDPYGPYDGRMDRAAVAAFFEEIDFPAFNRHQDAGRSWASAREEVRARAPHLLPALDIYVDHFAASLLGPVDGMEPLVRDLRATGVRLLGLTNWSAETFHTAEPVAPAIGLLEDVLVSGREGLAKPDPAIFRLLAHRYGLDPARSVVVDDAPANVDGARAAGFRALLFTDAERLRADLVALGLAL